MSLHNTYEYWIDDLNGKVLHTKKVCFSSLFPMFNNRQRSSFVLNLYMGNFGVGHDLKFTIEEIAFVFDKLSKAITPPEISSVDIEIEGCKYNTLLAFDFKNKTSGYFKTVLTICRYFYETEYIHKGQRSMIPIMRDTIDHCIANPEDSFIEIFQLMQYDVIDNSNHGLVNFFEEGYPTQIISEETFIENMDDPDLTRVYYSETGVFKDVKIDHSSVMSNKEYLKTFKTIKRV